MVYQPVLLSTMYILQLAQLALVLVAYRCHSAHDVSILGTEVEDTNCKHVPTDTESTHRLDDERLPLAVRTIASEIHATAGPIALLGTNWDRKSRCISPHQTTPFPRRLPPVSQCLRCTPAAQPISSSCVGAEVFQFVPCRSKADCGE